MTVLTDLVNVESSLHRSLRQWVPRSTFPEALAGFYDTDSVLSPLEQGFFHKAGFSAGNERGGLTDVQE